MASASCRSVIHFCRSLFTALLVSVLVLPSRAATGQPWSLAFGVAEGVPSGWTQVRENSVEGSRLGYRDDLGVLRSGSSIDTEQSQELTVVRSIKQF
jgi:hypothetical protein